MSFMGTGTRFMSTSIMRKVAILGNTSSEMILDYVSYTTLRRIIGYILGSL